MQDLKVLIVEDDKAVALNLESQLKKIGYTRIDRVASNEEALEYIEKKENPDVIFMDIFLPGKKNGIDTALEIYKRARIPVVFTSGPENLYLVENAKLIKSSSFLAKPFELEALRSSIEKVQEDALKRTPEYIEAERLRAISLYEIIDTPREGNFDRITRLAATLLNVPIALISIVDDKRIWFKSRYGLQENEIPKNPELFASAFLSKEFYHSNGHKDELALKNPILAHDKGYKFYASAPLLTKDGYNLGVLCVIDRKSRQITGDEQKILTELAAMVMDEMELRLAARRSYRLQREFLSVAIHDLKNPLAGILSFSEMLKKETSLETIRKFNVFFKQSADKMLKIIEGLLQTSILELEETKLSRIPIRFIEVVDSVIKGNRSQAERKNQELIVSIFNDSLVSADPNKLGEAMDNLLSNAIKYGPEGKPIQIIVKESEGRARFEVIDEGPGLTEEEQRKVFQKFPHLSPVPTGGESSTGLGLSIAKKLVELHGGTIKVESDGKNKGSKFSIELPVISQEELKKFDLASQDFLLQKQ